MKTTKKIYFGNRVQKALFDHELCGQMSDGKWENVPGKHWEQWCDAETEVAEVGQPVGTNFYPKKSNYNFAAKDLLECVGDRMINIANMAYNGVDDDLIRAFNDVDAYKHVLGVDKSEYWVKKYERFLEGFGSFEAYEKAIKGPYDMEALKNELRVMMQIIRERI